VQIGRFPASIGGLSFLSLPILRRDQPTAAISLITLGWVGRGAISLRMGCNINSVRPATDSPPPGWAPWGPHRHLVHVSRNRRACVPALIALRLIRSNARAKRGDRGSSRKFHRVLCATADCGGAFGGAFAKPHRQRAAVRFTPDRAMGQQARHPRRLVASSPSLVPDACLSSLHIAR
jgi:hypothetical protein